MPSPSGAWPLVSIIIRSCDSPRSEAVLHDEIVAVAMAAAVAAIWRNRWYYRECLATAQLVTSRDSTCVLVVTTRAPATPLQCAAAPAPSVNCLTRRRTLPCGEGTSNAVRGVPELVIEVAENDTAAVEELEQWLCDTFPSSLWVLPAFPPP
mmetsp:Transcript_49412/g.98146  ORF Transcript_49412/g.98146 Transcript_49412/m.98146 type:complete len:152 (+) Transcript_49412:428-883(+)